MKRVNITFWGVISLLLSASVFFGVNAEKQRRLFLHGEEGTIANGDVVRIDKVVDGDTVVVSKNGSPSATIRILGIKAFDAKVERDAAATFGKAAVDRLEQVSGRPVRVLLNTTPKDAYGRYLATLYVNDRDLGLELVREGLVLVYSVHPFPAMPLYLQEQELARAGKKGLWRNREVKRRAIALIGSWQEQT